MKLEIYAKLKLDKTDPNLLPNGTISAVSFKKKSFNSIISSDTANNKFNNCFWFIFFVFFLFIIDILNIRDW